MDTVLKLSDYGRQIGSNIRIIGIPKTIDNDLCCTDHTPASALLPNTSHLLCLKLHTTHSFML